MLFRSLVFAQDKGCSEFYQLYRFDPDTARVTLLTDGKSRNGGGHWSRDGRLLTYTSTRRNGKDTDFYLVNPADPKSDRLLVQTSGGGWGVCDFSPDGATLLVIEEISINESYLHLVDVKSGAMKALTPRGGEKISYDRSGSEKVSYSGGQFKIGRAHV